MVFLPNRRLVFLLIRGSSRFTALMADGQNGTRSMVKYLLNFLFVFLILSSFSFAKNDDTKLQSEYGYDLIHAPFFLRFAFEKEFTKDWQKSDYPEREAFLKDYETNLAAEQKKEQVEAK